MHGTPSHTWRSVAHDDRGKLMGTSLKSEEIRSPAVILSSRDFTRYRAKRIRITAAERRESVAPRARARGCMWLNDSAPEVRKISKILSPPAAAPCSSDAAPWILAATILGSSLAFIDGSVVNLALPALQANLGATVIDVQWVVEAYALFLAALILVGGSLGDIYGRKRIYIAGIVLFATASIWCGLAPDVSQLIFGRAVQGIGAALLVPGSLAIISASFQKNERGRAIGTWSGFTSMTAAAGPVLGGFLIEHGSWRWVFFINVPLALVVLALTLWRVPESRNI